MCVDARTQIIVWIYFYLNGMERIEVHELMVQWAYDV